jgi:hypothetical protein
MIPTFFAVIVLVAGLISSSSSVMTWQVLFCLFGGSAAVMLPALGGASLSPAVAFLPFLMFRAARQPHWASELATMPRAGFWLVLTVGFAALGAYYLPRMFSGETMVMAIDRLASSSSGAPTLIPLHPVSGNVTQTAYAIGAVAAFFSFRALMGRPRGLEHFRDAVLLLSAVNCVAAVINLAEYYLGLPSVLALVRNGGYAMFEAYEEAGLVRIQGTWPETSAFCGFTLPLFAFCFSLWLQGVRAWYSGTLAFVSLGFLLISTSGTAYFGLSVYLVGMALALALRALEVRRVPRARALLIVVLGLLVIVGSAFLFETAAADKVVAYLQQTVMGKMDSRSGVERSTWNRQAWQNFLDSYGLGVGLGSTRASSFLLVLLSNLGLLGTVFYGMFLSATMRAPSRRKLAPDPTSLASRQAMLAMLGATLVAAPVFDLGLAFYGFAAACTVQPELLLAFRRARSAQRARLQREHSASSSSSQDEVNF